MTTIITLVEGYGEVQALPILLRKLIDWEQHSVNLPPPKNAHCRTNLTRPDGLEKFLELARRESCCDGVLILLDADDECAGELACSLADRARTLGLPFPVAVVCAKFEYEAWFLASLKTIAGKSGTDIPAGTTYPGPVEGKRGVKEWLTSQMPEGTAYKETQHQASMTAFLDPDLARKCSRSFRRLEHALGQLLEGKLVVTPECKKAG